MTLSLICVEEATGHTEIIADDVDGDVFGRLPGVGHTEELLQAVVSACQACYAAGERAGRTTLQFELRRLLNAGAAETR